MPDVARRPRQHKDLVEDDRVCFVTGAVDKSREQIVVQLTRVLTLEQGQKERTTGLVLTLDLSADADRDSRLLDALAAALKRAHCAARARCSCTSVTAPAVG